MLERKNTQEKIDLRIGELLVAAEILSEEDLQEAISSAYSVSLPLGRVLIMAGFCTETEFQAALHAQSLVRDSILPLEVAVKALNLVSLSPINFDEALKQLNWIATEDKESNKLGELLLASDILPQQQLDTAMRTSQATGLPLGRLLVSLGILSDELLATALNAQILIRAGRVNRSQAISGLKACYERLAPFETTLSDQGFYRGPCRPTVRLGELLVSADLISEEDVLKALEESLIQEKSVGRILIQNKVMSVRMLNHALALQEMVSNETVSPKQAAIVLNTLNTTDQSIEEVLAFLEVPEDEVKATISYHDLLRIAGVVKQEDLENIPLIAEAEASSEDAILTASKLIEEELLDIRMFLGSLRCYFLVLTGWLNLQQGIISLNYFQHKNTSFDDVLLELKWTVRTYEKEGEK
jgi:hypothetical protein